MSSATTGDLVHMERNASCSSLLARSKKLPPPPLCLPATNTVTDEEKIVNPNQPRERKKSSYNCCLSSSSEDCPHKSISYILPVSQRSQIIDTLIASSSALLAVPSSETKNKKSYSAAYVNQINLLKQRQSSSKGASTDNEWIDFMRLIVHQSLEDELKSLLDKYKSTYFDRVNAPNTTEDSIRSSLCAIVAETLATYSSSSVLSSSSTAADDLAINASSPASLITTANNGSSKRKRKHTGINLPAFVPITINSQTKFVISQIIPGKYDNNNNGNKTINQQQQQKQFQKKFSHLFKYIPDKDEQTYLAHEGYLKSIFNSSSYTTNINNDICLMLYDEVVNTMDEYDLELSGISPDDSFLLPESFLAHIYTTLQ